MPEGKCGGDREKLRYNFALYGCRILDIKWDRRSLLLNTLQNGKTRKGVCFYWTLYVKGEKLLVGHTIRKICYQQTALGYYKIEIRYCEISQATEIAAANMIAGSLIGKGTHYTFSSEKEIEGRARFSDFLNRLKKEIKKKENSD